MSLARFKRVMQRDAASMDQFQGVARRGIVTNFDPIKFRAMVTYQPSGAPSGWLSITSQWVGAGWGILAPLQLNDQVLVLAEDGDSGNGVIVARYYSEIDTPPQGVGAGELWLIHQTGSKINLKADGSINITSTVAVNLVAPAVNLCAALTDTLRGFCTSLFASWVAGHVHSNGNGGGNTGVPTTTAPAGSVTTVTKGE